MPIKRSLTDRLRHWLIEQLGGYTSIAHDAIVQNHMTQFRVDYNDAWYQGVSEGERRARLRFAYLPMPFTAEQLAGRQYGEFITPVGFGIAFGESNIPAPSEFGYEQRAYYVNRSDLEGRPAEADLRCHGIAKFGPEPLANPDTPLVPVLVTVLR